MVWPHVCYDHLQNHKSWFSSVQSASLTGCLRLTRMVLVFLRVLVRCSRKVTSSDSYWESVWNKFGFNPSKRRLLPQWGLCHELRANGSGQKECCCNLRGPPLPPCLVIDCVHRGVVVMMSHFMWKVLLLLLQLLTL